MDDLLIKYLLGEATPGETVRVRQWLSEDAGNRERYEQLKKVWEISGPDASLPVADAQPALLRLKQRLTAVSGAQARYRFLRIRLVAAVFAGIVCLGAGMYWIWSRPAVVQVAEGKKNNPAHTIDPAAMKPGSAGLQTDMAGNNARIDTLPDGSVVMLHKHAAITYASGLKGQERTVRLEGEAFFSVVHNPSKLFVVQVNNITVKVLGTSFTIRSIGGSTEVIVKTGVVQVTRGADSILLYAGEKVAFGAFPGSGKHMEQIPPKSDTPGPGVLAQKKHPHVSGSVEKGMQETRAIIADMVNAKIVVNKDSLSWFALNKQQFVVDGKPVPDSLYRIFKSKYIKADGFGYYYGPVKIYGKGLSFEKKDLY